MDNIGWQFHPRIMLHYISMMQDQYKISAIYFDAALTCHLVHIWNLRIIYPKEDILTQDNDVSGSYIILEYSSAVADDFSFTIMTCFFLPTGSIFVSSTSPKKYESFLMSNCYIMNDSFSNISISLVQQSLKYIHPVLHHLLSRQ